MRELNSVELADVSGGSISDIITGVGDAIGSLADSATSLIGRTTSFSDSASTITTGINQLLSLDLSNGVSNIASGVSSIFSNIVGIFFG